MSKKHNDFDENTNVRDEAQGSAQGPLGTRAQLSSEDLAVSDDYTADLERQVAALTEALQRERADATNLRRRYDEQIAGLKTTVKASVVRDLLPVVDNFERALKHVPKDLEGNDFVKGVQVLVKQFEKTLGDIGVHKIKTVGQPFNPHLHDAVSTEEGDGEQEMVSEELQAGYQLGTGDGAEVLRPAMVRVKTV